MWGVFLLLAGTMPDGAMAAPLERWIYLSTNLLVPKNVEEAKAIIGRGAAAGYTHILLTDSKFSRLDDMPPKYFDHCEEVKKAAEKQQLKIIPALFGIGYSNDLLSQNPNLAEGLPVRDALFVVRNGEAKIVADPPVSLPGCGKGSRGEWGFVDEALVPDEGGFKAVDPSGNARFHAPLTVAKFRCYTLTVRIKTQDFHGEPAVKVLAPGGTSLSFTNLQVKSGQDWTTHHVTFNSLDHEKVGIYFGTWGAARGTIWWTEAQIHEEGPVNILRREGCPLVVKTESGHELREGPDFEPLSDPRMGEVPYAGSYEIWHEPPSLRTGLPDGTRLRVSYYHPHIIYDEQVCICPSEPATIDILRNQAKRLHGLWQADAYMMQHDEWRVLGWDESCRKRGLPAGALVADNVRTCQDILAQAAPAARIHVWSDMFDPHHNAVQKYYLVNGDLRGSWEGLDPRVVIVNWNSAEPEKSLRFFAGRGHKQILAGYYDSDPEAIKPWLAAARDVPGVIGVMYTTWKHDYSQLEAFARKVTEAEAGQFPDSGNRR